MSNNEQDYGDWTAGKHWRQAAAHTQFAKDAVGMTDERSILHWAAATAHATMAKVLLDHPPVDVLDTYLVELGAEPPEDWRLG
jgi:ankyrin repeat protein